MVQIELIGKGQYQVGPHQQFVDREGNLVRIVRGSPNPVPVGEAYASFNCRASQEEIEEEIPTIRRLAQIPNKLELQRQVAGKADRKYVIKASYPTATNRQAADELAGILNQAYQSPLYQQGEPFRGRIIYKEGREYVSRN